MTWAVRHVLSIPTNVVIIVSSALAYFYVAGVQAFAIVYLRGKFDLSQEVATALLVVIGAGVIAGILATGHISDKLIARGHGTARPLVGGVCFLAAVVVFVPGFSTGSLLLAMPLLFVGAAALGGVNPPLDAARLDIVQSRLWGRAESIRTFCQNLLKAGSPLLFGYLSAVLGTGNNGTTVAQGGGAVGLNNAFLLLLALFVVAGIVLLVFRRGYLRDAATAMESEERVAAAQGRPDV
jgi:sugar phosphate permease